MYKKYQENIITKAINDKIVFFEQEILKEEKQKNIIKKFVVVSTDTNTIDMKIIIKSPNHFIMKIRDNLEEYKINKIKTAIKIELLKIRPYEHINYKEKLITKCNNKSNPSEEIEKEYLKYALKSANIFQMSDLDKKYLKYFITHKEESLDNNTLSFIYMVLDKFLDSLTKLPNRVLLQKTISKKKEVIFELGENNIEIKKMTSGYLMFIDLNNLKAMNDIYGHTTADVLLIIFAKILKEKFKETAHFRIGGDEFISTTKNKNTIEKLSKYLHSLEFNNEIKKRIEEETKTKIDKQLLFFASNGISEIDLEKETLKNTINKAEKKMYVNKVFLHLEFGVYDRRSEGKGEMSENLIGKLKPTKINKIKQSKKFQKMSSEEQYNFLNHIKKNTGEIHSLEIEKKNIKNNEKDIINAKIEKYKKSLNRLLSSI